MIGLIQPFRSKTILAKAAVVTLLLATSAVPARGEMIDHGALEQLFGEPVTTSATGQPQRASEAPADMIIITSEDIRRSGARDIPGVLRHIGGVDILQWTSDHTDVSVRGYNREYSSRILVLINGRQVYADYYGFTPWFALPVQLNEIRQIELVKGPNSALFGFNAAGGVINIVTFNPMADDVNMASVFAGTQDHLGSSAVGTFRLGENAGIRLSAGARRDSDFSSTMPPGAGTRSTRDNENGTLSADGVLRLNDNIHIMADASYTRARLDEFVPVIQLLNDNYETSSVQGRLFADTPAGLIEATAYTNHINAAFESNALANLGLGDLVFDNRVTVFRLQDLLTYGNAHTLRASLEYRMNGVGTAPNTGADIEYEVFSVSGMWNWKINSAISLTNALRLDNLDLNRDGTVLPQYPFVNSDWDRTISEFSYNSGLVWRAGDNNTVRLITSRGVQLPNLVTLGAVQLALPTGGYTGSPFIDPSVVSNYEIGWDREFPTWNLNAQGTVFYQRTEDMVSTEGDVFPVPPIFFVGPQNVGDSEAWGFETGFEGKLDGSWIWGLDYRFESVTDDYAIPILGGDQSSNAEDTTPKHLVNVRIGWSRGPWEVDGYFRYQSDVSGVNFQTSTFTAKLTPVGAFATLDGRVAYALNDRVTLSISGQNLTVDEQRQTSGAKVERTVTGTLTFRY